MIRSISWFQIYQFLPDFFSSWRKRLNRYDIFEIMIILQYNQWFVVFFNTFTHGNNLDFLLLSIESLVWNLFISHAYFIFCCFPIQQVWLRKKQCTFVLWIIWSRLFLMVVERIAEIEKYMDDGHNLFVVLSKSTLFQVKIETRSLFSFWSTLIFVCLLLLFHLEFILILVTTLIDMKFCGEYFLLLLSKN